MLRRFSSGSRGQSPASRTAASNLTPSRKISTKYRFVDYHQNTLGISGLVFYCFKQRRRKNMLTFFVSKFKIHVETKLKFEQIIELRRKKLSSFMVSYHRTVLNHKMTKDKLNQIRVKGFYDKISFIIRRAIIPVKASRLAPLLIVTNLLRTNKYHIFFIHY